jgi:hypothetical protein
MFHEKKIDMLKKILIASICMGIISGCQQDEVLPGDDLSVTEIVEAELPQTAATFILTNYDGEVITSAFRITNGTEVSYEANLTNQMNIVFSENGRVLAFGEDGAEVDCKGKHRKRGGFGGPHGKFDEKHPKPTVLELKDLPIKAASYLEEKYPDHEILKIIFIEREELNQYHVLVKEVGIVVFDASGTFIKLRERPLMNCANFQKIEIADLPTSITSYIQEKYPDNEILRARKGTRKEVVEIHVLVKEVGVLIFDAAGVFIELKTCGMDKDKD